MTASDADTSAEAAGAPVIQKADAAHGDAVVAVAQFAPGADPVANLATATDLVRKAVAQGADLVVLPEYTSYFAPEMGEGHLRAAESLDGDFVTALAALADETGVSLVAGMIERLEDDPGRFANTLVALQPGAGLVATYRKEHLYDAFGGDESRWIRPGDPTEPTVFRVGALVVGMQTCYDLRFPEVTRRLVDAGADVVLVPAEWVRGPLKEYHWRTLACARAIENTVYVAAADHTPPIGVGQSMIIDPMGVVVAAIGEQQGLAIARISMSRVAEVRLLNPALAVRRYRVVPR